MRKLWVFLVLFSTNAVFAGEQPLHVKVITAKKQPISQYELAQGTARAEKRAYLVFQNQGKVAFQATPSAAIWLIKARLNSCYSRPDFQLQFLPVSLTHRI